MGDDPSSTPVDPGQARAARLAAFRAAARPVVVTPSMLDCDFTRVGEELDALSKAGALAVHLDVMDGHFVPNLSYGPPVVKDWRARTDFPFDTHLMMSNPEKYVDAFADAGADVIIFHIEVHPDPVALAREIRSKGCEAGICLNPPTPVSMIEPYLDEFDSVLVMSVMPGFGGQKFDASVLEKVRRVRALKPEMRISIDGGIKPDTAADAVAAGVSQLVVGSAVLRYPGKDYATALARVAEGVRRGLERGGAAAPGAGGPSGA
ncbi:MAG: ribulose-phosphate 3-epimerase [Isosphaeraceae bacterium]